jgi:hypothetical protein
MGLMERRPYGRIGPLALPMLLVAALAGGPASVSAIAGHEAEGITVDAPPPGRITIDAPPPERITIDAPPPGPIVLSDDEAVQIARGGHVIRLLGPPFEGGPEGGEIIALVEAPAHELWAILVDYERSERWMPDTSGTRVIAMEGDRCICSGVSHLPFPFRNRRWHLAVDRQETRVEGVVTYRAWWRYVPGSGNISDAYGHWTLVPYGRDGTATLVRYGTHASLGGLLPRAVIRWGQHRLLPDAVAGLAARHSDVYGGGG